MATLLRVDGSSEVIELPERKERLKFFQEKVGGYIEVVRLGQREVMIVNEEGRLKGLPVNEAASNIYGGIIVGDVVLCNRRDV